MAEETRTNDPIHLRRDNAEDAEAQVDAATDVTAAAVAFNSAALPPDMPEWRKSAIRAKAAEIIQAVRDDELRLTDAKQREEEAQDALSQAMSEREWDRSNVEIGSVTMSGEEWDRSYETLSDPKLRSQLIQHMARRNGWSQSRAEKAADDALTLAQIARKKKDGTITAADEAQADEITRRNPDAAVMVKEAARMNAGRGLSSDMDSSASAKSYISDDVATATTEYQHAMRTAPVATSTGKAFASAPPMIAQFEAARDNTISEQSAKPALPVPQLVAKVDISGPF